jgi:predicted phosphoribosyltransferase
MLTVPITAMIFGGFAVAIAIAKAVNATMTETIIKKVETGHLT